LDTSRHITREEALTILIARDRVEQAIERGTLQTPQQLQQVYELDSKLQQNPRRICANIDLATYRQSLNKTSLGWWWYLDNTYEHHHDRWDWLYRSLSLVLWTVILAFLINIGNRFFQGGLGVSGAFAVILPSLLTLLKARSEVTKAGQRAFTELLHRLQVPKQWHEEVKLSATGLLLLGLLVFWFSLPKIANLYNQSGYHAYHNQAYSQAESLYKQAISLDSEHAEAHYNLGVLYEDWGEREKAEQSYQIAASQGNIRAHNNLARLLIFQEKYAAAVHHLQQALVIIENYPEGESAQPEEKYSIYKNLGWARLQQERYRDAQRYLFVANKLAKGENKDEISKPGSVHCLLAQVYEKLGKEETANEQWQSCCQLASRMVPEEDAWLHRARQQLEVAGKSCP
jgi:Tfp pilus assembly protein PilF